MRALLASLLLACAGQAFAQSAAPDPVAQAAPMLQRAEAAATAGKWNDAANELRAARYLMTKAAGAKDPRTLHAGVLLVEALTRGGKTEEAIGEGASLLGLFAPPAQAGKVALPPPDALILRYQMAQAFTLCQSPRCGGLEHRMKNVDALMETMLAGLAAYPKGDARVAQLRVDFAAICAQRYEPADCAPAQGR